MPGSDTLQGGLRSVSSPKNAGIRRPRAGAAGHSSDTTLLWAIWMTLGAPDCRTWPVAGYTALHDASLSVVGILLCGRGRCPESEC